MRRRKKIVIAGAIVVLLAAGAFAVVKMKGTKDSASAGQSKTVTVDLSKMDLVESISATGTLESASSESVSANVSNIQVKKVLVSVGDTVKAGDRLVAFDESDLTEALQEAKDNLSDVQDSADQEVSKAQTELANAKETYSEGKTTAAAEVKKAKASLTAAKKTVNSLQAKIKKTKDAATKATLQQQLSQAQEKLEQAQTSYDNAKSGETTNNRQNKSNVTNAQSSLTTAKSNRTKQVKDAKKQVEEAQENLDNCAVTATMDGTVTSVNVEAGDSYTGGTLVKIQDTSSFEVTTSVDEYDIGDVKEGQRVVILTDATGEEELEGEITFVAPSTDSSSDTGSTTGTAGVQTASSGSSDGYEVKIKLSTQDDRLKLGMTAKCSIVKEEAKDVFAVPYDAVHNDHGENYINVLEDDTSSENTRKVTVTKGMETDYYVQIEGDDLQEGMKVVIPSDKIDSSSSNDSSSDSGAFGGFGGMDDMNGGNGAARGGNHDSGKGGRGDMSGGPGNMSGGPSK